MPRHCQRCRACDAAPRSTWCERCQEAILPAGEPDLPDDEEGTDGICFFPVTIRAKAGTAIKLNAYISGGAPTYNLYAIVKRLA